MCRMYRIVCTVPYVLLCMNMYVIICTNIVQYGLKRFNKVYTRFVLGLRIHVPYAFNHIVNRDKPK